MAAAEKTQKHFMFRNFFFSTAAISLFLHKNQ